MIMHAFKQYHFLELQNENGGVVRYTAIELFDHLLDQYVQPEDDLQLVFFCTFFFPFSFYPMGDLRWFVWGRWCIGFTSSSRSYNCWKKRHHFWIPRALSRWKRCADRLLVTHLIKGARIRSDPPPPLLVSTNTCYIEIEVVMIVYS
jgi:hypothetical protein